MKWMKMNNIVFKKKNSKKLLRFKSLPRVYHSSCLVLSPEHKQRGAKINMFKNDLLDNENIYLKSEIETKTKFDVKKDCRIESGNDKYLVQAYAIKFFYLYKLTPLLSIIFSHASQSP